MRWEDIDLSATPPTLTVKGTIKTEASVRTTVLPEFAAAVLRRRLDDASASAIDAVFPTRNDTWLQVSNVQRRWREIRADAGLD